jgi:aldose 1-epimerase
MTSSLQSRTFGHLPTGEPVDAWVLSGAGGMQLETITYGGIVTRLLVPDCNGQLADVVLGYGSLDPYLKDSNYFGAIVGRVAGRIPGAQFYLDGEVYKLAVNDPPNHLHGGRLGFDKVLWCASPLARPDKAPALRLARSSPDGEEGYPGNVDVSVTYTVTDDNYFLIETEAATTKPTPFSLTHHSYYNLAGERSGSVLDHKLQIEANIFVPTDASMTPLGRLDAVVPGVNDFRSARRLGDAIPQLFQNHGDLYQLRGANPLSIEAKPALAARLVDPASKRMMEVFTNAPFLQLYTAAAFDSAIRGKSGAPYPQYAAVCLECQGYPDGANAPELGDIILRPGQTQRQTTAYAFSVADCNRSP